MRTTLSRFSEEFVQAVRPLLAPLDATAQGLASIREEEEIRREVLPQLREVQHQLGVLVDKVADQHAFVLIFGPLKSGKSTLMNALAAAYVSEVSCLPAYPCMVYVTHAEQRSFQVTRYDGRTQSFTDPTTLQLHVQRSHGDLANALRRAEDSGEQFDPAVHFTEAIRRIDVRTPAPELAQSGAVLVDTPGLYSRMKFGYDRMTRDFRNVAACAIFVVKSDNLFLEQVFAEFGELLDLFSRIFLVINVDSTKQDLGPDGDLLPSLEQTDPLRIVEAFESYAMSAPLKRAADDGRLRIYPIDLMCAASRRLRTSADHEGEVEEPSGREVGFESFQRELADFLNSTDYLHAFINDSLRRAQTLNEELTSVCHHRAIEGIARKLVAMRTDLEGSEHMRGVLEQLTQVQWEDSLSEFRERVGRSISERARDAAQRTADHMDGAVDRWFQSNASLEDLLDDDLVPALEGHRNELHNFVQDTLQNESATATGGLELGDDVAHMLEEASIRIDDISAKVLTKVHTKTRFGEVPDPLRLEDVPIRKRLVDWLLFRGRAGIRTRLFGPADHPTVRVSTADKASRLGEPAKVQMKRTIDRTRGNVIADWNETIKGGVLAEHAEAVAQSLRETIEQRYRSLSDRITKLEDDIRTIADHSERVQELSRATEATAERLAGLHEEHTEFLGDTLVPAERGDESLEVQTPDLLVEEEEPKVEAEFEAP